MFCNFIKKDTLAQVFSCEFCEISINTFVYRTPQVVASESHILHLWLRKYLRREPLQLCLENRPHNLINFDMVQRFYRLKKFRAVILGLLHSFTFPFPVTLMIFITFRSSNPEVFCKRAVLKNFAKFTDKHLCQSLFFNKVAGKTILLWILRNS